MQRYERFWFWQEIFVKVFFLPWQVSKELPEGTIMQKYMELQEQTIKNHPYYWLWSHWRWKL